MSRFASLASLASLVLLAVSGCFDDRPASRDETYDTTCSVDDDCVVVAYASCAACGSCGDEAIAADEQARFDADNEVSCPPPEPALCGACPTTLAVCTDGTCAMISCGGGADDPPSCTEQP